MVSAPLMQGKVQKLSAKVYEELPPGRSKINQALEFILSTPGVTTAFCGMKELKHFEENRASLDEPVWPLETWHQASEILGLQIAKKE